MYFRAGLCNLDAVSGFACIWCTRMTLFSSPSYTTMLRDRGSLCRNRLALLIERIVYLPVPFCLRLSIYSSMYELKANKCGSYRSPSFKSANTATWVSHYKFWHYLLPREWWKAPFIRSFHSSTLLGVLPQCGTLYIPPCRVEPKRHWLVWAARNGALSGKRG